MTTATIDLEALDNLFDNQKKLDDIFSSVFDDDSFLSSPILTNDYAFDGNDLNADSEEDSYFNVDESILEQKRRNMFDFIIPVVLEITIIYYSISYFS